MTIDDTDYAHRIEDFPALCEKPDAALIFAQALGEPAPDTPLCRFLSHVLISHCDQFGIPFNQFPHAQ